MANKFIKQTWPMANDIFDWVKKELRDRKNNVYSGTNGMSEIRTPFVRFTSGLTRHNQSGELVGNSRFLTLGLHGYREQSNIFELTYGNDDIIGYAHEMGGNSKQLKISSNDPLVRVNTKINVSASDIVSGTHPVPGISKVSVTRYAIQPSKASIDWVCYNLSQLEYLRHYFLTPGIFCVLDWGHIMDKQSILTNENMINFNKPDIHTEIASYVTGGKFGIYEKYIEPSRGNYDVFVGVVSNFNFSFDAVTQRYICNTQLMSMSEIFYGMSTDHTIYTSNTKGVLKQSTIHDYFNSENGGFMRKVIEDSDIEKKIPISKDLDSMKIVEDQVEPDHAINKTSYTGKFLSDNIALSLGSATIRSAAALQSNTEATAALLKNTDKKVTKETISITSAKEDNYITLIYFLNVILPDFANNVKMNTLSNNVNKLKFNYWNEPIVGYSLGLVKGNITRGLLSLDVSTCILIDKIFYANNLISDKFENSVPIKANDVMGAQLSAGVWVNTKKIMECMMNAQTLNEGIQAILNAISTATGNFWKLRLVYNEHLDLFQIIDEGCRTSVYDLDSLKENAYMFNEGTKGELVSSLEFNSTLTNEIASQVVFSSVHPKNAITTNETVFDYFSKLDRVNSIGVGESIVKYNSDTTIGKDLFALAVSDTQEIQRNSFLNSTNSSSPSIDPNYIKTFYDVGDNGKIDSAINVIGVITSNAAQGSSYSQRVFDKPSSNASINDDNYDPSLALKDLQLLDPNFKVAIGKVINRMKKEHNLDVTITETYRTQKRQVTLFDQGKTGTLDSKHKYGIAADVVINNSYKLQIDGKPAYELLHKIAVEEGMKPTLTFTDKNNKRVIDWPHLEWPGLTAARPQLPSEVAKADATYIQNKDYTDAINSSKEEIQSTANEIYKKFGNSALSYVDVSKDAMLNRIISYTNQDIKTASSSRNSTSFPTTSPYEASVEVIGISGIVGADVFLVDKIPDSFNKHGMFQTVEINHNIDPQSGWKTKIRGKWMLTKPFTEN